MTKPPMSPGWRTERQPMAEIAPRKRATLRLLLKRPLYRALAIAIGLALVPVLAPFIGILLFLFFSMGPIMFLLLLGLGWSFVPTDRPPIRQ
jgi:hypothetical protein